MKRPLCFVLLLLTLLLPGTTRAADVPLDMERGLPLAWAANPLPIFTVYWDDTWNADHPAALSTGSIDAATRAVVDSAYESKLAQYGAPAFTFEGSAVATPACGAKAQRPPDTVDTSEVVLFLLCETRMPGSGVPAPGLGRIYNVMLPDWAIAEQGIGSTSFGRSCDGFGGYHFAALGIIFTVQPAACAYGDRDALLAVLTHELAEAATDPVPLLNWIDESTSPEPFGRANPANWRSLLTKGEAAAICGAHHASPAQTAFRRVRYAGTRVASYWSNDDDACVVADKRVVHANFQALGPPGAPGTVVVDGREMSTKDDEAFLEGTEYYFPVPATAAGTRYVLLGDCAGVITFPPQGNTTADASQNITCTYVRQHLVRFDQTGLSSGAFFTVNVNGLTHVGPAAVWVNEGDTAAYTFGDVADCTLSSTLPASPLTVFAPEDVTAAYDCAPATYADLIRADGPIGYWRLGETARIVAFDWSGNGLDGSYEPGVGDAPGALAGDTDAAARFTAGAGVVVFPYSALNLSTAVTVEVWARSTGPGAFGYLVAKSDFHGSVGYALYTGGSGTLRFFVGMGGIRITPDRPFAWDGAWHHIVAVYDGASVALYVDKALFASAAATGPIAGSATRQLTFGRYNDGGFAFNGDLDEIAVYGYALSSGQIAAHYDKGAPGS